MSIFDNKRLTNKTFKLDIERMRFEERLRTEGQNSPADVLITVDIGRLEQAKEYGVTQPVKSAALESAVRSTPAS